MKALKQSNMYFKEDSLINILVQNVVYTEWYW